MTIDAFIDNIITKLAAMRNMTIVKQTKVVNDFNITNDLSLTSVLSDKLSTRIIADSSINVDGGNEILQNFIKEFQSEDFKKSVFTGIGTGDCLILIVTNGEIYSTRIVPNGKFAINKNVGSKIYSLVAEGGEYIDDKRTHIVTGKQIGRAHV